MVQEKVFEDEKIFNYVRKIALGKKNLAEISASEVYNEVKLIKNLLIPDSCDDDDLIFFQVKEYFKEVESGKIFVSEAENSPIEAIENILKKITATTQILMNIVCEEKFFETFDINDVTDKIAEKFPDAEIFWSTISDEEIKNKIYVVIVTD